MDTCRTMVQRVDRFQRLTTTMLTLVRVKVLSWFKKLTTAMSKTILASWSVRQVSVLIPFLTCSASPLIVLSAAAVQQWMEGLLPNLQ